MATTEARSHPTYHDTDSQYALPNDSTEHKRLNRQAQGLVQLLGGSPVLTDLRPSDNKILVDVGCGTGAVTAWLASEHLSAIVYGVDLSPVPPSAPRFPNLSYVRGNIRDLTAGSDSKGGDPRFAPGSLDFVFNRLLVCGITDWPGYIRDVVAALRPGGRVEMQDVSYALFKHGKRVDQGWAWFKAIEKHAGKMGLDIFCGEKFKGWFQEAGLEDVEIKEFSYPFGTWLEKDKPETGVSGRHNAEEIPGVLWHMLKRLVGDAEDEQVLRRWQEDSQKDMSDNDGLEWRWYVATGKKPE